MASVERVLDIARGELGYNGAADPEEGSKYGRWMADLTGERWLRGSSATVWWCCMFVSWVLDQAGQACPGFPSYNTQNSMNSCPGEQKVSYADLKPGDIVIWDWDGNTVTDHIGFVESVEGGRVITLEGNVDNEVKRVDRTNAAPCVACVIRPQYEGSEYDPGEFVAGEYDDDDQLTAFANRVIEGEFGNAPQRADRIYAEVQAAVNELLFYGKTDALLSTEYLANLVIEGKFGNYPERVENLYRFVQQRVNSLYGM